MPQIPILMYHSISDTARAGFRRFAIPPALFSEQMAYLDDSGYRPITVTRLAASINTGQPLPDKPVVLTFDDGYADFYTAALPTLMRYGFTATLYPVVALVGQTSRWLTAEGEGDRPMLTWEQISEVSASGIECGSHTLNHPQLDSLQAAQAYQEIVRSRQVLEERLQLPVTSFCYPYGFFSSFVRDVVQKAGYTSACAVRYVLSSTQDDPYALSRLIVTPDISPDRLAGLLQGQALQTWDRVRSNVYRMLRHLILPRQSLPGT